MITKILAGLMLVGAVAGLVLGYVDLKTALSMIWAGLAVFGIRQAVNGGGLSAGGYNSQSRQSIW